MKSSLQSNLINYKKLSIEDRTLVKSAIKKLGEALDVDYTKFLA